MRRNMKTGNRKPKTFFCPNTKMEMGFQSRIHKLQQLRLFRNLDESQARGRLINNLLKRVLRFKAQSNEIN